MKKILKLSLLLLPILLVSCDSEKKQTPHGLISKDTMVMVLSDLHIAQARVGVKNLPQDSSDIYYMALKYKILDSFNIQEEAFKNSYSYYLSHVEDMDGIYSRVVDSLGLKEAEAKAFEGK